MPVFYQFNLCMEAPCGPFVTSAPSPLGRHSPSHLGPPWSQPALRSGSSGLSPWKPSSYAGSLGLQGGLSRRESYGPRVCVCMGWRWGAQGLAAGGLDPVPVRGVGPCHFGRTPSDPSLFIQSQRCLGEGMRGPVTNRPVIARVRLPASAQLCTQCQCQCS